MVYVPRQDGVRNGLIKDYEIFVSQDGKEWTSAVKGTFPNDLEDHRILFPSPVKARFIRFKALSSQNGQDYAAAAEFKLLVNE